MAKSHSLIKIENSDDICAVDRAVRGLIESPRFLRQIRQFIHKKGNGEYYIYIRVKKDWWNAPKPETLAERLKKTEEDEYV